MARRAGLSEYLGGKGRYGDTMVAHINPEEAALLKARGGAGTRNPRTGLLEFYYGTFDGGALEDDIFGSTPESAYTYADPNAAPGGGNYDPNIAAEQKAAAYPDAIRPILDMSKNPDYEDDSINDQLGWFWDKEDEEMLSKVIEGRATRELEWQQTLARVAEGRRENELEWEKGLARKADAHQMAISAGYIRPDGRADTRAYFKDIADKEDEATAAATAKYWKDNPEGKWEKIGNVRSMVMPPRQPTPAKIAEQNERLKAMDARAMDARRIMESNQGLQPVLNDPLGRAIAAATPLIGGPNQGLQPFTGRPNQGLQPWTEEPYQGWQPVWTGGRYRGS